MLISGRCGIGSPIPRWQIASQQIGPVQFPRPNFGLLAKWLRAGWLSREAHMAASLLCWAQSIRDYF